jgi:DNA-binding IclR family transcriptional regulator
MTTPGMDASIQKDLPVELQLIAIWATQPLMEIGPSEAQQLTGISKGTLSPKLKLLADAGWLIATDKGRYTLGPALPRIFLAYIERVYSQAHAAKGMIDSLLSPLGALTDAARRHAGRGEEASER